MLFRFLLLPLATIALELSAANLSAQTAARLDEKECVVLLHGLWRTELSMLGMKLSLEDAGYGVANVTYPSLSRRIPELAEYAVKQGLEHCY